MSIEEAEHILNEAVITEPSINSYTYISAEEINTAINKMLEERLKEQKRIKELESIVLEQKSKLENIIEIRKKESYKPQIFTNTYLSEYINKIKKSANTTFLLEN